MKTAIAGALHNFGFDGKGGTYFRSFDEVILVVSLRKSTHGAYFYLDCGVLVKSLMGDSLPKANECHIQFNFNLLAKSNTEIVLKALDLETSEAHDIENLVSLMNTQCLPIFVKMSSLASLREMKDRGELKSMLVLKSARELLE